jgi:hypothetical protein
MNLDYINKALRWYDEQHFLNTQDKVSLIPSLDTDDDYDSIGLTQEQFVLLAILYNTVDGSPTKYVMKHIEALVPLLAYIENGIASK